MPTVAELFEHVVQRAGETPAVLFGERVVSYSDLNIRANRLARELVLRGVGPDSTVAVAMPKSDEMMVVLLAVLKAGGAYLPLDPHYPAQRLTQMVEDARPALLVRPAAAPLPLTVSLPELMVDAPGTMARIAAHPGGNLRDEDRLAPLLPQHLMYVIYTSGSTGVPKGVAVTHSGVADIVAAQAATISPQAGDRVLQWASISFDAAFWDWSAALLSGATLVLAPAEQLLPGPTLHNVLQRYAVTHAVLPPVALSVTDSAGVLTGGTVMSTGDACTPALVAKWAPGRRFFNGYGPTETTVGSTIAGPVAPDDPITIGMPWQGNSVHVLDERLLPTLEAPLPLPETQAPLPEPLGSSPSHLVPSLPTAPPRITDGELYLSGNGLARGYLNQPGLTATRFVANPFGPPGSRMYRSGDRGHRAADGQLVFSSRGDDQVKIRGFRVELGEVEACLAAHPAVEVAAAAVTGDVAGARLTAYVSAVAGASLTADELRVHAAQTLPEHMVPASVRLLPRLPVTVNGKIDRSALLAMAPVAEVQPQQADQDEPLTVPAQVIQTVRELLDTPEAGPEDNFFKLGGHSMLATRLAQRLRDELGVTVPMRIVFQAETLSALAAEVHALSETKSAQVAAQVSASQASVRP